MNPDLSKLLPRLRAMALYALGDATIAQDVAQEAIARALARAHEVRGPDKAAAFVVGITRHIITDHIRAKRRVEVDVDDIEIAHAHPDALANIMAEEQRNQLRAALQQLSADDREILRLSYEEGLGPAEIAAYLAETSTVVRKRKSRAIERLRALMTQIESAGDASHKRPSAPTDRKDNTVSYRGGGHIATEM